MQTFGILTQLVHSSNVCKYFQLMIRNAETMWRMHFYPQLFTRYPLNFNPLVFNLLSFCILWNEKRLQLHVDPPPPFKSDHY